MSLLYFVLVFIVVVVVVVVAIVVAVAVVVAVGVLVADKFVVIKYSSLNVPYYIYCRTSYLNWGTEKEIDQVFKGQAVDYFHMRLDALAFERRERYHGNHYWSTKN